MKDRDAHPDEIMMALAAPGESLVASRLVLTLIGGLGLHCAGAPIALTNRKGRALLAYLALEGHGRERRERLAELFWGGTGERNARACLRQTLMELREALTRAGCAALRVDREAVALADIELDLDALLTDLRRGELPAALSSQAAAPAMLLAGYDDLSPGFTDWLATARQSWQARLRRMLEEGYGCTELPPRQRLALARAAFALDPLDEAACRAVMRLAAEEGETGTALRAYADLYAALGEELDMEPANSTQALVAEIKQGRLGPALRSVPAEPTRSRVGGGVPMVAVLPLRPLGPDPTPDHVAEGVLDDIVCTLAGLREPVVISSNSTRRFRDTQDLPRIGQELGVQYAVTGTLRCAGSRIRLSVELADTASRVVLWAQIYDTIEANLFETQDHVAATIANTLAPRVHDAELRRSRGRRIEEIGAYHLLLQARELVFRLERGAFEEAGLLLRRAAALDPGYPAPQAALADWYSLRIGQGWSRDPAADASALEAAARVAIARDSGNARALALLGHNRTILARDYGLALELFERALAASPNDAETWMWTVPTLAYAGEGAEAVQRAKRAITLSPQDPFLFRYEHFLSIASYAAGELESAAHWGQRSVRANPHYTSALRMTAASLAALGRRAEAAPFAERILSLQPGFRVAPMIASQAFRDDAVRQRYGQHLVEAGLPP